MDSRDIIVSFNKERCPRCGKKLNERENNFIMRYAINKLTNNPHMKPDESFKPFLNNSNPPFPFFFCLDFEFDFLFVLESTFDFMFFSVVYPTF